MDSSATSKSLRFGCPACGIRLVVDQSIAGTEGPCPSCGARIVAPPIEAANSLVEKQAAPVAIQPRRASSKTSAVKHDSDADSEKPRTQSEPNRPSRSQAHRRSVSPNTIASEKHTERQNTIVFVKITVAILIVAAIAIATFYILKNAM